MKKAVLRILFCCILLVSFLIPVLLVDKVQASSTLTLRPNGAGDETSIDGSYPDTGEAHWEDVDESVADNNATYVKTNSLSYLRDLYDIENHTTETGTINSIKIYFCISTSLSIKTVYAKPSQKSGITITDGTEVSKTGTNNYETFSETYTTNPATGVAYTWVEIDALQVGVQIKISDTNYYARCTQVYVEVDYTLLPPPGAVTDSRGIPTATTINLMWTPATSSNSTVINYSTTTYPATVADGTNTYNGTGSYVELDGLTAGTNYYFSAWGFDGADYGTVVNLMVTTDSEVSANNTMPFPAPALPANIAANPDTTGWDISPIDDILDYFSDPTSAHGGLGMETNNFIMFLVGLFVVGISLTSYIKWRSFFSSWFIALILSAFCAYLGVMQWLVVPFLLVFGVGVWSVQQVAQ